MRTLGARQGSTRRLTFRRRLAAGAALCIATTTAAVVGASVPALADVSAITVTPSRAGAGELANYTVAFTTTVALVIDSDTVTLTGPAGTVFPLIPADYTINGTLVTATPTGGGVTVTLTTHVAAPAGTVTVVASRVTNPAAGSPTMTVSTSKETNPVASTAYTITAATAVSAATATVSPAKISSAIAIYTVHATTATSLLSGYDTITLGGPAGTSFPVVANDYTVNAGGATTTVTALPTQSAANNVTIMVPAGSTGGSAPISLTVTASGVTNPPTALTTYNLTVSETADSIAATSANYTIGALTAVTGVSVSPSVALAGATSTYTVGFTATTALVIDNDTVTIVAPTGTVFPAGVGAYTVNGVAPNVAPTVTPANVTIKVHSNVPAGAVPVVITGVTNPASGSQTLTLATSEDSTPVTSPAYVITSAITGTPTVTTNPTTATALAMYTVGFTATSALTAGTGTITLVGTGGTAFPLVASAYTINGTAVTTTPTGSAGTVVLTTPVSIGAAGVVTVIATGVTNPAAATKTLAVSTSSDVSAVTSASYVIGAAGGTQANTLTVTPSPATTGVSSTYTIGFHTTAAVVITSGTITIVGPTGTVFPATAGSYTVNGTTVVTASGGATAVLHSPVAIATTTPVTVVASGVTNPAVGLDTLTVATTGDTTAAVSPFYAITAVVSSGGGGPAPTVPAVPVRLSGADRFGTAIAASLVEFPTAGSAGAVVLARSDDYPDALVGTALAAAKSAPLLFANGGLLTLATQAEIQRVLPAGGTVYLLGGTTAIPASVATTLTSLGFVPVRYAGTDRFGTALAVAAALNDPSTVLLATGINFPDALAAGPAAAHLNGVVLLTNGSSLTPAVTTYLAAHPGTVYAIGGPAVAADPSAIALSGADRYATAAMVASTVFTSPSNVGLASGTAFPDALSGGAFQAHFGGPIVLTDPHVLPTATSTFLTGAKGTIVTTNVFGGTTAVSVTVQTAIGTALGM